MPHPSHLESQFQYILENHTSNSGDYLYVSTWASSNLLRPELQRHWDLFLIICPAYCDIRAQITDTRGVVTRANMASIPCSFDIAQNRATSSTLKQALAILYRLCIAPSLRSFACCYIFKLFFWLIAIFVAFGNYTERSSLHFGLSSSIDAHLFDTHEHQQ